VWQQLNREICAGCGEPKSESMDPANELAYQGHALRCHACAARDARANEIQEDEQADTTGLFLSVTKKPRRS
jgi:hypothetical protein